MSEILNTMPTAKDMDSKYLAEMRLFGGSPSQHEDRLREDPAYRAAHTPRLENNSRDGIAVGTIEFDKERRKLITIFFNQLALRNELGQIVGIATYNPKTKREHFEFPAYLND